MSDAELRQKLEFTEQPAYAHLCEKHVKAGKLTTSGWLKTTENVEPTSVEPTGLN